MNIDKRIKKLHPYVLQIRFVKGVAIVDVVFKNGWRVPESKTIGTKKGDDNKINYYMFYTEVEELGLDDVFDYVEQVINLNVEREKKYELLKIKTEELKDLFRLNTLNDLENLEFVLNDNPTINDVMPDDFDTFGGVVENKTPIVDNVKVETLITDNVVENKTPIITNVKHKIELPPKSDKIILEDYSEPTIICKCVGDDICPVCVDEKML